MEDEEPENSTLAAAVRRQRGVVRVLIAVAVVLLLAFVGGTSTPIQSADFQTTYPATIKGIQDVDVRPKVSGFITAVYVHEGQRVSAGQVMFTIDSETYRSAVRQARAALNTASTQANTAHVTYLTNKKRLDQHII